MRIDKVHMRVGLRKDLLPNRIKRFFYPDIFLDEEISSSKRLLDNQKKNIFYLFIVLVAYGIFGSYVPDFKLSQLWIRTDDIFASVMKYWYLFAWGFFLIFITLSSVTIGSFTKAKKLLGFNMLTSLLAGLWEEIAFRGLLIFVSMITLMFLNFALTWVVLVVLVILALWGIISLFSNNLWLFALMLGVVSYFVISWWYGLALVEDPLYWFYQHVIFPVMSFISFGLLDSIMYNKEFSLLFIIAAMSANLKFRDGHKYQGCFGYFNSWIIGYILLHVMMYHGLVVAIIIHAVYDIIIGLVYFSKRLILAKKESWCHAFVC